MPKLRKKPVVVEAHRLTKENVFDLSLWCHGRLYFYGLSEPQIAIAPLEGVMMARLGDWIIRGVNGEFYPCKPDVFEKTYELIEG